MRGQAEWGKLTDDDLDIIDGRRKELAGRIQVGITALPAMRPSARSTSGLPASEKRA